MEERLLVLLPARECKEQREAVGALISGLEGRETEMKARPSHCSWEMGKAKDQKTLLLLIPGFPLAADESRRKGKEDSFRKAAQIFIHLFNLEM